MMFWSGQDIYNLSSQNTYIKRERVMNSSGYDSEKEVYISGTG